VKIVAAGPSVGPPLTKKQIFWHVKLTHLFRGSSSLFTKVD